MELIVPLNGDIHEGRRPLLTLYSLRYDGPKVPWKSRRCRGCRFRLLILTLSLERHYDKICPDSNHNTHNSHTVTLSHTFGFDRSGTCTTAISYMS